MKKILAELEKVSKSIKVGISGVDPNDVKRLKDKENVVGLLGAIGFTYGILKRHYDNVADSLNIYRDKIDSNQWDTEEVIRRVENDKKLLSMQNKKAIKQADKFLKQLKKYK